MPFRVNTHQGQGLERERNRKKASFFEQIGGEGSVVDTLQSSLATSFLYDMTKTYDYEWFIVDYGTYK